MPCDVTGYPIPWIFWTRDGKTVQNSTKNGALTINQAQEQMTGIYTCVAQNEVGVDTYDVLLLVTSCKHQNIGVRYHLRGERNLVALSLMHCNKAEELYLSKFAQSEHLVVIVAQQDNVMYPIQPQIIVDSRRCCRLRQKLKCPRTRAARAQQYILTTQPITHCLWPRRCQNEYIIYIFFPYPLRLVNAIVCRYNSLQLHNFKTSSVGSANVIVYDFTAREATHGQKCS